MLLLITREHEPHADAIEAECSQRGIDYARCHLKDYPTQASLTITPHEQPPYSLLSFQPHVSFPSTAVKSIWYYLPDPPALHPHIPEELVDLTMQEVVESLQDYYVSLWDCFWLDEPRHIRTGFNKLYQLHVAAQVGFQTPATLATNAPDKAAYFLQAHGDTAVYKPLMRFQPNSSDNDEYMTFTTRITWTELMANQDGISHAPCLFQELIPKVAEFTVFTVGNSTWPAEVVIGEDERAIGVDWRLHRKTYKPATIPDKVANLCLKMTRQLGLNMCNYDIAYTVEGDYIFLDANPTEQWLFIENETGLPITAAVVDELIRGFRH